MGAPTPSSVFRTIPLSFFGMAVGTLALANAWRGAVRIWAIPALPAVVLAGFGLALWTVLIGAYLRKWAVAPDAARAEMADPVQSSFAALIPTSTLLATQLVHPYAPQVAMVMFGVATVGQLALGAALHGRLWQGGMEPAAITPAAYLPAVAPGFVGATAAAMFGWHQVGMMLFGVSLLSWLAIESMLLNRAAVNAPLPEARRALLGIQIAPPVVGGTAWMALTHGQPDLFAYALLGYGLYQALVMLRLAPWIGVQRFSPGLWAFSFGVAALPGMAIRMVERGAGGVMPQLAFGLFVAANAIIGVLLWKTAARLLRGDLLPAARRPDPTAAAGPSAR
ncbi:dicarboxylate transporter/tellurite-resistance protein TehA [Cupriavidus sp. H18C2]|uniref:dicarboxylate transporter/tellurite-resistance protein TehA n=1 Tax=Cupriavidus sp. H18C2 TaxID=3241602 RepID=UPI003BF8F001